MARLIDVLDFYDRNKTTLNPFWYFPDTTYYNGNAKFTIASGYPFSCAIPEDKIMERYPDDSLAQGKLRMEIRRWVERNLEGDVILQLVDKTYRYRPKPLKSDHFPDVQSITHRYYVFHFETISDMMHFRLNFSDHVVEMSNRNPKFSYLDKLAEEFENNLKVSNLVSTDFQINSFGTDTP